MLISIGICTKDNPELLKKCLAALYRQNLPKTWSVEILIADSSRTPKITSHLIRYFFRRRFALHLFHIERKGIVHGRNLIFAKSSGHYLFSLDDDVIADKEWITTGVKLFHTHPNCGIIGGRIRAMNRPPKSFIQTVAPKVGFSRNFWPFTLYDLGNHLRIMKRIVHYPMFANMAIRKNIYQNIKLDTRFANQEGFFQVYGGEDPDFIEQAKKLCTIIYSPDMLAWHYIKPFKFEQRYFFRRFWENGKERALLERKYNKKSSRASLRVFVSTLRGIIYKLRRSQDTFPERLFLWFSLSYFLTEIWLFLFPIYDKRHSLNSSLIVDT